MATIERSSDLAIVGANGGGWTAPVRTPQPAAIETPPDDLWVPLGAISSDGLTVGFEEDSESFTPWGLSTPFRTVVTSSVRTFQLTLWETARSAVISLMYRIPAEDLAPDPVTETMTWAETGSPAPDRRAFLFDVYDGENLLRYYLPEAEITDRGDVVHSGSDMRGFEVTISAYPDAAGNTVYHSLKVVNPEGGNNS